jgi:hypothetical protein
LQFGPIEGRKTMKMTTAGTAMLVLSSAASMQNWRQVSDPGCATIDVTP